MFKYIISGLTILVLFFFKINIQAQEIDTLKSHYTRVKNDTLEIKINNNDTIETNKNSHNNLEANPSESLAEDSAVVKIMEVDSTLLEESLPSEFIFRIDYFNKTLSAGRDLGLNQFSIIPSITYYHKSGMYSGISGNWYSQTFPNYSLTDLTVGYSNLLGKLGKFSYSLSYDHFFFNPSDGGVLTNALGIYGNYDLGLINVGINYSYLFGNKETGHKISPSIGAYFKIKHVGFIDKITIMPSLSMTFGSGNLPFSVFVKTVNSRNKEVTVEQQDLNGVDVLRLLKEQHNTIYNNFIQFENSRNYEYINNYDSLNSKAIDYINVRIANNPNKPERYRLKIPEEIGLLSYNLSIPVKFTIGKVKLGITYNYVIPVQLPYQIFHLKNQSYFSANISYLLEMKSRRKKIK